MTKHTGKWYGVMLHHTAGNTKDKIAQIRKAHINNNKWGDIGYHYVLEIDDKGRGHLKTGRSLFYQGAHSGVDKYNNGYIGLCIPGNYEKDKLSPELYDDLINAICTLEQKFCTSNGFLGHREVKATACPGKNIDLNQIRQDLTKKLKKSVKPIKL